MWAQVMFFGALLSAILSTASGALLAPTALFTENVDAAVLRRSMGDRQFLLLLRMVLVIFTLAALLFALNSKSTMYEMVQNAYKVTLVSCIVPLAAGIYWKRANNAGRDAVGGVRPGVLGHRRALRARSDRARRSSSASLSRSSAWSLGSLVPRAGSARPPAPRQALSLLSGAARRSRGSCSRLRAARRLREPLPAGGLARHRAVAVRLPSAPWPRYVTCFDMVVNVLGYVPFGFLAVRRCIRACGAGRRSSLAAAARALSLVLEARRATCRRASPPTSTCCAIWPAPRWAPRSACASRRLLAEGPLQRACARRAFLPGARDRPRPGAARAVAVHPAQPGDAAVRRRRPARSARRRARAARPAGVLRRHRGADRGGEPGCGRRCCFRRRRAGSAGARA